MATALYILRRYSLLNPMESFLKWAGAAAWSLLEAGLIFLVGWWLSSAVVKLLRRALERTKADGGIITFICSFCRIFLQIVAGITAISKLGVDVSSIVAALATAGVAIGLALKDSMGNIASGIQIIFMHPFHVGDYISIDTTEGTVSRIELFFTSLTTFDNKEVVIPNSTITASTVVNFTAMETRRLDLKYTVSYSDNLSHVKDVLSRLCTEEERILDSPAPMVVIGDHMESGISVLVRVWCKTDDYWPVYFSMQEHVKTAFDEENITIPFNQMDIRIVENPKKR